MLFKLFIKIVQVCISIAKLSNNKLFSCPIGVLGCMIESKKVSDFYKSDTFLRIHHYYLITNHFLDSLHNRFGKDIVHASHVATHTRLIAIDAAWTTR